MLQGQRVVVLGGTSGIGLATAVAAASAGASVTVVSSSKERVDQALSVLPDGCSGEVVDLADADAVRESFTSDLDHLVFTAGESLALMPVADLDLERAKDFFGLRYFGALTAVQAAVPHIRPGGSITLTTGVAKDRPNAGWSVAASICGAVDALTRALAVELAPIRVNAVSPGVVRTPLWGADPVEYYESVAAGLPVGRVGDAEDIARAYLFFMTCGFATGTVLTVDGGARLAA